MSRMHKLGAAGLTATVLMFGGVGAALAAGGSRTYRGKTSQSQAFRLVKSGKTVKSIAFNWVGKCTGGSAKTETVPYSATGLAIKHGAFSDSRPGYVLTGQKGLYGGVQIKKLSGNVTGHKTTGTFSFQGFIGKKSGPAGNCTGSGTWHATHK